MVGEEFERAISLHCPLCGYTTATVSLPIVTLDRATLRAALARSPLPGPEWDGSLQPHCPSCHYGRLLLDIGALESRLEEHATA